MPTHGDSKTLSSPQRVTPFLHLSGIERVQLWTWFLGSGLCRSPARPVGRRLRALALRREPPPIASAQFGASDLVTRKDASAADVAVPGAGGVFNYLVRARNACRKASVRSGAPALEPSARVEPVRELTPFVAGLHFYRRPKTTGDHYSETVARICCNCSKRAGFTK